MQSVCINLHYRTLLEPMQRLSNDADLFRNRTDNWMPNIASGNVIHVAVNLFDSGNHGYTWLYVPPISITMMKRLSLILVFSCYFHVGSGSHRPVPS
jgi:hypothetical protein